MTTGPRLSVFDSHSVANQPPPLAGGNAWRLDPLLRLCADGLNAEQEKETDALGRFVGSFEAQDMARLANTELPRLRTHDRQGHRIDQVEYHPAYHALMRRSIASGLHSSVWERNADKGGGRHLARAVKFYMTAGLECGHLCPVTMTSASVAALMTTPAILNEWGPRILARAYDSSFKPPVEKNGLTLGMGMTEKQGGTDVRANTTSAERTRDGFHVLTGHKWFMSAPMSDAFLMLAQAREGLSCFMVPRIMSDGSLNGLQLQRLKDKLGNRSNASSEVEIKGAVGQMIGNPGEGVKTILEMVTLTRLDCALASAGLMRAGLAEAVHHARHRSVFGKALVDQPLMTRVLADMAIDVAAATALSIRLARSYDLATSDPAEAAFARAMTPVVKYWVCKIAPPLLYEAMECLGGNGYVEEGVLARAYREAPVNAIWEGSGNVMALDVLRVLGRSPRLFEAVLAPLKLDLGPASRGTLEVLKAAFGVVTSDEGAARILTEQLALAAAAAELRRLGMGSIADAFVETRLGGQWRTTYGMLDARFDARAMVDSLYPPR